MRKMNILKYGLTALMMAFAMTMCYSCSSDDDEKTNQEINPPSNGDTSNQQDQIKISVGQNSIRVQNAQGLMACVYIGEIELHREIVHGSDVLLNITLSAGTYIVRIGGTARKVTIH